MENSERVCIVGAGFSGAVLARRFSEAGIQSLVIDERDHVAGNCHTVRDTASGIMVHRYGPHIFHTNNERVWTFINQHGVMMPYHHKVKTTVGDNVYLMPINLHTINQFFGKTMSPAEARSFIEAGARMDIADPRTFEEQALRFVGDDLYKAFFSGYTRKQWGLEPSELPASILKRLPLRFTYNDDYFSHPHQAIPKEGYTRIVESILNCDGVEVRPGCAFEELDEKFLHVFYTGPLDRYFGFELGRLGYRTLDFEEIRVEEDLLGCAVMNYGDYDIPYTRISDHKHFAPWELDTVSGTVAFREFSRSCGADDIPYYPIRLVNEKALLRKYMARAEETDGVTFLGRLGSYAYLDMDVTIARAFETADQVIPLLRRGDMPPAFIHPPLEPDELA